MHLIVLLLLLPTFVLAQEFPARPITIVVPYPPRSTSDLIPRTISPLISESLSVPMVIENRPNTGGNISAAMIARGDTTNHTLVSTPTPILAINQQLYKDPEFDPRKDFTPVINAAMTPNMWMTHPDTPVKTIADVIQTTRAKPGALTFASNGSGTTSHLYDELLKATAKIDLLHVPYKGPAPALQDVMAGRVQLMCDNFSNVISHMRSGKLKAIALTALNRHPQAPKVPTAHKTDLPGFEMGIFYGFAVPSGTPPATVQRLNTEIAKALREPKIAERLTTLGLDIVADSPESFTKFITAERERIRKLMEASGARVN